MFFRKKPKAEPEKPQPWARMVIYLNNRRREEWSLSFIGDDAIESADARYKELIAELNAAKDDTYIEIADDLTVRRGDVSEIHLIKPKGITS